MVPNKPWLLSHDHMSSGHIFFVQLFILRFDTHSKSICNGLGSVSFTITWPHVQAKREIKSRYLICNYAFLESTLSFVRMCILHGITSLLYIFLQLSLDLCNKINLLLKLGHELYELIVHVRAANVPVEASVDEELSRFGAWRLDEHRVSLGTKYCFSLPSSVEV